jgi:DNA-binding GntR family transcriptional regulator
MPAIKRTDPPYMQIAGHIRERIVAGELADGDRVPSARQISADWKVALATATKVLSTLRAEGFVRALPGIGTVVNTRDAHPFAGDRSMSVVRTGRIYPPGHYARILSAELTQASEQVADALGIDRGSPVIRRARVTYDGADTPVAMSVSWFDGGLASRAPRLLETERIHRGTFAYVAEQTGRTVQREYSQLSASAVGEDVAEPLGVEPGSPVLVSRARFVADDGSVIEYGESTARPGLWVFVESSTSKGDG